MKNKVKLLVILLLPVAIWLFTKCGCHSCLADGESLDLPYSSNQDVSFINDSKVTTHFISQIRQHSPQSEYCGAVGSGSYGVCQGEYQASLRSNSDTTILITLNFRTDGGLDDVEMSVIKLVTINNCTISIKQGVVTTSNANANTNIVSDMTVNNKPYKNVFVYQNNLAKRNECSYFVFSVKYGVLKYSIVRENFIENFTLAN